MEENKRIVNIHTGEEGVKSYLAIFFKEFGVEKNEIPAKVEEAFKFIIDNPDKPNIFGIKLKK